MSHLVAKIECVLINSIQTQRIMAGQKEANDLSIGSTETKYRKLNTKTQNSFFCLNENLTTFLYTLTGGGQENRRRKKISI